MEMKSKKVGQEQLLDQIKNKNTQRNAAADQVHKADHGEIERQRQRWEVAPKRYGQFLVEIYLGETNMKKTNDIKEHHAQRKRTADPKQPRTKKRLPLIVNKQARHFHQRKNQALVLNPLTAEDDDHTETDKIDRQDHAQPPAQRPQPHIERQVLTGG